jgi:2-oxoglutarate dehydrogenase E2 component (dihydrolipoamide succinyltransferase)
MVTEVTMPQMGETVTEGTITAWLKQPGDEVAVDEPLLEISTDKVDSEIPAPQAGVVAEILVAEGETVPIGTPIARITTAATDTPDATDAPRPDPEPPLEEIGARNAQVFPPKREGGGGGFLSPVVRRLVAEHDLDPATIPGSGREGRITRDDVLALVGEARAAAPDAAADHVPFTAIRRTIGQHMVRSLATAAHTLVVVEVDYAAVEPAKEAAATTWLPFIARAVIGAIGDFPLVNAHVAGDGLDVHRSVHLGVAVDLDFEGLVVPVVRDAQDDRLPALASRLADRAAAARERRLGPDDFAGGTFTITNAGRYGTLLTAPIINQPQVAILSTDGVRVRPVAIPLGDGHGLAFHPVGNLALSFDHRAFDGAYASAFAARVRELLETTDWMEELE